MTWQNFEIALSIAKKLKKIEAANEFKRTFEKSYLNDTENRSEEDMWKVYRTK